MDVLQRALSCTVGTAYGDDGARGSLNNFPCASNDSHSSPLTIQPENGAPDPNKDRFATW